MDGGSIQIIQWKNNGFHTDVLGWTFYINKRNIWIIESMQQKGLHFHWNCGLWLYILTNYRCLPERYWWSSSQIFEINNLDNKFLHTWSVFIFSLISAFLNLSRLAEFFRITFSIPMTYFNVLIKYKDNDNERLPKTMQNMCV